MSKLHRLLNRLFKHRVIRDCITGDPYLYRWFVIRTKPVALYIHQFVRSDYERALHDHPWNFLVIPIWRGYIEHHEPRPKKCFMCDGKKRLWWTNEPHSNCTICDENGMLKVKQTRVYPIIGTRFRRAEYKHRVELLRDKHYAGSPDKAPELPSWSIFIRLRERRTWGFWLPEGWKKWNIFEKERCV